MYIVNIEYTQFIWMHMFNIIIVGRSFRLVITPVMETRWSAAAHCVEVYWYAP